MNELISDKFCFLDEKCNPGFLGVIGLKSESTFDSQSIVGLVIWMCCVLYSSLRTASSSSKITMSEHVLVKDNGAGMYYISFTTIIMLVFIYDWFSCLDHIININS